MNRGLSSQLSLLPTRDAPPGRWGSSCHRARIWALASGLGLVVCGAAQSQVSQRSWIDAPPFSVEPAVLLERSDELAQDAQGGQEGQQGQQGDVQVLLADTTASYDAEGRRALRQRLVYRILTAEGLEGWSVSRADWSPWHQERPEIRARVVTPDGRQHLLDPKTLSAASAAGRSNLLFDDRQVLQAPLPALAVGAIVEEETLVREFEPFFDHGAVYRHSLAMYVPVERGRLTLEFPTTLPLRYIVHLMPDLEAEKEVLPDGRARLVFNYQDVASFAGVEEGLPYHEPRFPQIAVATGKSWNHIAKRYAGIVDESMAGSDLEVILDSLGPPSGAQSERIDELLAKVRQEIRYTGLELGASSIIPYSPNQTLERKFGDCKDQATLLAALLRAEGIPAYLALLKVGLGRDVEPQLPGLGQFNHAIVFVPGSRPFWIDPTHPFSRAGELPIQAQNRLALIAAPSTRQLIRTPSSDSVDNRVVETREVYLSDYGSGRVVETSEYYGAPEREIRAHFASLNEEKGRQQLAEYVGATYMAEELGELDVTDPQDLSRPFRVHVEARAAGRAQTLLEEAAVAIVLDGLLNRVPTNFFYNEPARQGEYVFAEPSSMEWRYRIVPPPGMKLRALPGSEKLSLGTAVLSQEYRLAKNGEVQAVLRFDTGHRRISPEEFEELRQGVLELSQRDPVLVWFDQVGEAHLAAGDVASAIEEQRRLTLLEPGKAIHRVRLVRALMSGGMGEAALREARRAVELDPNSSTAHWSLGLALQHDSLGRRFGEGFNRQEALAALRRARQLDPDNQVAHADLAILLEHDSRGVRYGPEADLAEAIDEYKSLNANLEDGRFDANLLAALYMAQRFDELKTEAEDAAESVVRDGLYLTALAVSSGAEAAVSEAQRRFPDAAIRASYLSAAMQRLLLVRRYPLVVELMRRIAGAVPNSAEILQTAAQLAELRPYEEIPLPKDDPTTVVKRFLMTLFGREPDPDALSRLIHPKVLAAAREELESAWRGMIAGVARTRPPDMSHEVLLDLVLGYRESTVDGNDELGYRIRMGAAVGDNELDMVMFVVPHEAEYRIVATEEIPAALGVEVLRRLGAGDLVGARQWLDWAQEGYEPSTSDDPYAGPLLPRFWRPGDPLDPVKMRLAGSSLLIAEGWAEVALPILEQARYEQTDGQPEDPALNLSLNLSLAASYFHLQRLEELETVARGLLQREPTSRIAYRHLNYALARLGRFDEVRQMAEDRLHTTPDAPEALRALAHLAAERDSDIAGAIKIFEKLQDLDEATSETYNEWAWLLLFRDPLEEESVELAERAAKLSGYRSYDILHTLAAFYANVKRPEDAYHVMVQALELKPDKAPEAVDWYVFGRIAEEYGLTTDARSFYQRVLKRGPGEDADSGGSQLTTHYLAEKRLDGLKKVGEGKG